MITAGVSPQIPEIWWGVRYPWRPFFGEKPVRYYITLHYLGYRVRSVPNRLYTLQELVETRGDDRAPWREMMWRASSPRAAHKRRKGGVTTHEDNGGHQLWRAL